MLELPRRLAPNDAAPSLIDFGMTLSPPTGAADLRVDRPGSRFRIVLSWPPMSGADADLVVSRLLRAKSEGLRVAFPRVRISQGSPGAPVVDGADQAGTSLAVRGLTPGYAYREGYWLSVEDAAGQHYLHNLAGAGRVDAGGTATFPLWPALRVPFADGAAVHLARPMIEGLPEGDETGWRVPVGGLIALEVSLREVA